MSYAPNDKQYLAMLAIPILLSIVFGYSSDVSADMRGRAPEEIALRIEESEKTWPRGGSSPLNEEGRVKRKLIRSSLEARDYDSFLIAIKGTPFAEVMNKKAFEFLIEEYNLQKRGYRPTFYHDLLE